MLGIELDVSDLSIGPVGLRRSRPRYTAFSSEGRGARDMLRMIGRVQFADAQVMGRAGKLALADARSWSGNHVKCIPLSPGLRDAFEILLQRLNLGSPPPYPVWSRSTPCPCVHGRGKRGLVTYYRRTLGATRRQAQVLRCQRSS